MVRGISATLLGWAALGVAAGWAGAACAGELEEQLLRQAPEILRRLEERGCNRVGVLKFRAEIEHRKPLSDNLGPINLLMAERVEEAFARAKSSSADLGLVLFRGTSQTAATIPGASHLSKKGRSLLFSRPYPTLPGGATSDKLDAFVTGIVSAESNLESIRVGILAVSLKDPELLGLARFETKTTGSLLAEMGLNFHKRGAGDDPVAAALGFLDSPPENRSAGPRSRPESVFLEVLYDGQVVAEEPVGQEIRIREPAMGQKVSIRLGRTGASSERLAAVVKVNGENTLFRERSPARDCSKWILKPGAEPLVINGFQENNGTASAFEVKSPEESKALEMHYGPDLGTISLVVFEESRQPGAAMPSILVEEDAPDRKALQELLTDDREDARATLLPRTLPRDPDPLKAPRATRGAVVPGKSTNQPIVWEGFQPAAEPCLSVVLRYYRAR